MRRFRSGEILEPDPEINRTFRRLLKKKREKAMEDRNKKIALRNYVFSSLNVANSCIIAPIIQANNFELKPVLIQMVQHTCQFGRLSHDDSNEHISSFLKICDTQRINGVSLELIKLKLFSFFLEG